MKTLLLISTALLAAHPAFAQVLYNIDFSAPAQSPNQLVRTGAAPQFVTSIRFGTPTVLPAFGALQDQPLVLDMTGSANPAPFYYDQIQLNLPRLGSVLDVSFDFTSSGLIGSQAQLAVVFDTSLVRNVYFGN